MRRFAVMTALASLAAGAVLTVAPTADAAAAQCSYTPALPAKITVGQSVVGLRTPIHVTAAADADCTSSFDASVSLVHGNDSYFMTWDNTSRTDVESVYAFEIVPGTYRTAGNGTCDAESADYETAYSCSVTPASTVIKFAGHAGFTATRLTGRNKNKVTFAVRASRYDDDSRVYLADTIAIQRFSSGAWHTIHTVKASASRSSTWTYTDSHAARYRAVSAETASAFGAISGTLVK